MSRYYPAIWALINFLICLYGILYRGWNLQPLVYLLNFEIVVTLAGTLLRTGAAMGRQPWIKALGMRLLLLLLGGGLSVAIFSAASVFTMHANHNRFDAESFAGIRWQMVCLGLNYVAMLLFCFFQNGRFRQAQPAQELSIGLAYSLLPLAFILIISEDLLPYFPDFNLIALPGLAVALAKFIVDISWRPWKRHHLWRKAAKVGA